MNQILTGKFIALKRKEKNYTQEQLAERLGVSNKTVSKWENGKCMPDYSLIEPLCRKLDITVAELLDGESGGQNSIRTYDNEQILALLRTTQELEQQKVTLYGIVLISMGLTFLSLSFNIGGSDLRDFISGMFAGMSTGIMLLGVYVVGKGIKRK